MALWVKVVLKIEYSITIQASGIGSLSIKRKNNIISFLTTDSPNACLLAQTIREAKNDTSVNWKPTQPIKNWLSVLQIRIQQQIIWRSWEAIQNSYITVPEHQADVKLGLLTCLNKNIIWEQKNGFNELEPQIDT